MVDSKRYDPTITRFQKHTKSFVSGKTKKGHLNNDEREAGDVIKEEGILVKVDSRDLQGKTWEVKVDKKTYMCSYGDNIIYLPPCNKNGDYYIPKNKCPVEISIDKKSKINTITRIKDPNKQPIAMIEDQIKMQGSGKASLIIEGDSTSIEGEKLSVGGDVSVSGDVKIDTSKDKDLPDSISLKSLYKDVQILKEKTSDNNDGGE